MQRQTTERANEVIAETGFSRLIFKIADQSWEFAAIHCLNYETFVEEIPQHPPNPECSLVDRFHEQNTYAVCLANGKVVGMVSGRAERPFSLDAKVPDLDQHLPKHRRAVEIRLLAVRREFRNTSVFVRLVDVLARHFVATGCDLAVISGTVRQLKLYGHLGFRKFASPVGTAEALYQPMYLTLRQWKQGRAFTSTGSAGCAGASFLPGPVIASAAVRSAFAEFPRSHRSDEFQEQMLRVRAKLCRLTGAANVIVMSGSGTLANDAIAAQIRQLNGTGLVLSNGEFGERLVDHASRWKLDFDVARAAWGDPLNFDAVEAGATHTRPSWIWAVLSETSTGIENSLSQLVRLAKSVNARLCVDAVSALGLTALDLKGVWLASGVSGKGFAAYPGLAMVFHDGRLAEKGALPAYLDLATYQEARSVPFTVSSNLIGALEEALAGTDWAGKFALVAAASKRLRAGLRRHGFSPIASESAAMPGIVTIALPSHLEAQRVGAILAEEGIRLAYESEYLRARNWLQICLMGEFEPALVEKLPGILAFHVAGKSGLERATAG